MQEQRTLQLEPGKKVYFASDFHLGTPNYEESLKRERKVVSWLDSISNDAQELYLVGDVFDFWFEYGEVIPRGFARLLGKLAELSDQGVKIHLFTGNHDMWIFDYLPGEIGLDIYRNPITRNIHGKRFFIGHGDGLGPGDRGYKFIKKVFQNSFCQWLFKWIHPDLGIRIATFWSRLSRDSVEEEERKFLGEDKEWLIIYSKDILKSEHFDYFIFGHRHIALDFRLAEQTQYINLGDWITLFTYAVFDGDKLELKKFGT